MTADAPSRNGARASAPAPAWVRPATEYGPLAVFFVAYLGWGLLPATAALLVTTIVSLVLSFVATRRVPVMPVITAGLVIVFGGLTLWLQDETFIKLKPTIVQAMFAAVLLGGLAFGRPLLKSVLGNVWQIDDAGWRLLTLQFGLFFLAMALLNEIVWRTQSTDVWVTFKVFGIMGLTLLFALSQAPLISRHQLPEKSG